VTKHKIFIDGSAGTTGLQLREKLAKYSDSVEILTLPDELRKDDSARLEIMRSAELVFLCLPDDAARKTAEQLRERRAENRVIDTSTAHRVTDGWVYGFPELNAAQNGLIRNAKYVANPGCHATGAIALLAPLVKAGVVPPDYPLAITSVTGYTGGGKAMIADYETSDRETRRDLNAPRAYALTAAHKHIPEIVKYAGLAKNPVVVPIVADYPQGMQVIIPLHLSLCRSGSDRRREIFDILKEHYSESANIDVTDKIPAFSPSNVNADTDNLTLTVAGSDEIVILTAQFDNLGKGASGAALQNMCIMLDIQLM
jgi:N-acetyl-gamma-glutamyl-phosphate reductase